MKVEILSGDEVIGVGELNRLDPPMGVAFGPFHPTPTYKPSIHANVIGGNENDAGFQAVLGARGPRGMIECAAIAIEDFHDAIGEIQVSVMGIVEFKSYFGKHPDYKAYYPLS
jgi:hypothetical protein